MLLNRARANSLMDEYGIDALIATTPENVTYLSDYAAWVHWFRRGTTPERGAPIFVVLPRDESLPAAIVTNRITTHLSQWPSWIDEIYVTGAAMTLPELDPDVAEEPDVVHLQRNLANATAVDSAGAGLARALSDRGLTDARIAVDGAGMPQSIDEYLKEAVSEVSLVEAGEFFRLIRAVKTEDELERLRTSARVNEIALMHVIDLVKPGVTEVELAREYHGKVCELGGMPGFVNIHAGKRCGTMWEPSERPIRNGELVWIDGGCTYDRYHSDTGACVFVGGRAPDRMRERFTWLEAGMEAAVGALRPGRLCSEVTDAMFRAQVDAGAPKPFGFGHAVGIEPRDIPFLQPPYAKYSDGILDGTTDIQLEEGMVINLEVPYREWNLGSFQIEQTFVLGEGSTELLIDQPRQLFER